jgi:uncharacterized membrane protein
MKKIIATPVLSTLLCFLPFHLSAEALAYIAIRNKNKNAALKVAVSFLDSDENKWHTRGWYTVEKGKKRTLKLNAISDEEIFIHSYLVDESAEFGRGDVVIPVSNEEFFAYYEYDTVYADGYNASFSSYKTDLLGFVYYAPPENET